MQVEIFDCRSHFPNSSFGHTLNFDANKNSLFIDNCVFEDTIELDQENNDLQLEKQGDDKEAKNNLVVAVQKGKSKPAVISSLKLPPLHATFDKIAYVSEENKLIEKWLVDK